LRGVSGGIGRASSQWRSGGSGYALTCRQVLRRPHDDSLEGTAISISKDDGKTWSDMQILFDAGRHHANLQRLPTVTLSAR